MREKNGKKIMGKECLRMDKTNIYIYKYNILPKVLGCPLLMNRFDYFSNFYENKS